MRTRAILLTAATSLLLVAPAAAAHAGAGCRTGSDAAPTAATTTDVRMDACAFEPAIAYVDPGATVTFRNDLGVPHTVTGVAGGLLGTEQWQTGERTWTAPDEPGVHPFACLIHPGMVGAVVVDGGEVASASLAGAEGASEDTVDLGAGLPLAGVAGSLVAAAVVLALVRRAARPADPPSAAGGRAGITRP